MKIYNNKREIRKKLKYCIDLLGEKSILNVSCNKRLKSINREVTEERILINDLGGLRGEFYS